MFVLGDRVWMIVNQMCTIVECVPFRHLLSRSLLRSVGRMGGLAKVSNLRKAFPKFMKLLFLCFRKVFNVNR
jgi:hypothetical protein